MCCSQKANLNANLVIFPRAGSLSRLLGSGTAKGVFSRVRDVEETVLVLVLFVDAAHQSRCWGQDLVDKDENGLLGR